MNSDPNFSKLLNDPRVSALKQAFAGKAELFLVGGCLRDLFQNKEIHDLDLACKLEAEEILSVLTNSGIKAVNTGLRHGTVTAVIDESNIEITSFRSKEDRKKSIEEALLSDLKLRDFTINAIAVSTSSASLYDPLDGRADLKNKILRAPDPAIERFNEDPLRILRMLRLGPAENFQIEESTFTAAKSLMDKLKGVSIERVQQEFSKILISGNPRAALMMALELGVIELYFPEAWPAVGFEQNDFHTEDVFQHTLSVISNAQPELTIRLAAFFHDLGKPHTLSVDQQGKRHFYEHELKSTEIVKEVMPRLRYSNALTEAVASIVKYHMRPINCGPSGIRRLLRDLGPHFEKWRKFKEADHPPIFSLGDTLKELQVFDEKVQAELDRAKLEKQKKLAVSGYDLMELGYRAGPALGKVIKQLKEEVLEEPSCNNREYLVGRAKSLL